MVYLDLVNFGKISDFLGNFALHLFIIFSVSVSVMSYYTFNLHWAVNSGAISYFSGSFAQYQYLSYIYIGLVSSGYFTFAVE